MIATSCGVGAALLVLWAAIRSKHGVDRMSELPRPNNNFKRPDVFFLIGNAMCNVARRVNAVARVAITVDEIRSIGVAVVATAVAMLVYAPVTPLVPAICVIAIWLRRRKLRAARERAIVRDLPMTVDLLRLGVQSGLNVTGAITEVTLHTKGPLADELSMALQESARGMRLADALNNVALRSGDVLRPVIWSLTSTERYGAPLSEVLERLAHETRVDQEQRAEQAARRLSVQLLFPVAGCTLPAFALLTVVPLLAGSITTLASSFI